jgi:hypothetical protein
MRSWSPTSTGSPVGAQSSSRRIACVQDLTSIVRPALAPVSKVTAPSSNQLSAKPERSSLRVKIRSSVTASTVATRVKLSYAFKVAVPSVVSAPIVVS